MSDFYRNIDGFIGYRVGRDGSVWTCWKKASPNVNGKCVGGRSELGNEWRKLRLSPNRTGYPRAALYRDGVQRKIMVHLIVLTTFVGPRPLGLQALHDNDIKSDCSLKNLSWGTPQKNWQDRKRNGRCNPAKGEKHGMVKLTEKQVLGIIARRKRGESLKSIAKDYGTTESNISCIATGKTWKVINK